ncbi:MAG: desulfoferrodoxin [Ruminococcus sp.]|nr:desulfoferrodoxin [Ruminococcus sp.]
MEFYVCKHCGNIITKMHNSGVPVFCCGEKMETLEAGVTEAATEKHIPVVEINGSIVNVRVGSVEHPSLPEHYIQWIVLETDKGFQFKELQPGDKPEATFCLCDGEKIKTAYEYCNLHKLWKLDI